MGNLRPDIEAAKKRMRAKLGAGREIKQVVNHLREGERVEHMAIALRGMEGGLLVLTDQRLLLIRDRNQGVDEYPLDKVTSVRWSTGFPWGRLSLVIDGREVEFHQMSKDEGRAIADTIAQRVPGGIELVDSKGRIDVAEQIRKLAELRDAGIVTAEEFEAKKAELLARM